MKNVVQDLTSAGIDWQREKWQSGLGSKFIHQGEKNAAKYADEVIVLSKGVQDYFKETYSAFSARAFSGLILQTLNWKMNCRYQCRGICRGQGNAKFLIFELDESRILIGKNQYEQIEGRSMDLKCRLYRHKWVQSITVRDVMESGQVVENPMIGAIPSRNEVQRELDDLLMSMQEDLRNGRKKQGAGNECSGDLANS